MPIALIELKKERRDARRRYRARWTNPYDRREKPRYKVHWDKAWLQEWGRQMDAAAREEKLNPRPLPRREDTMTFNDLVAAWRDTRLANCEARTVARYEGMLRNYLLPAWGTKRLTELGRAEVKRYLTGSLAHAPCQARHPAGFADGEHTHSSAQVRKVQILASSIFSEAVDLEYVSRNPASRVNLADTDEKEMLFLTPEELDALAQEIDGRYKAVIYVAGYAGLRASELWALQRQDVDLSGRRLHVRRALKRAYGQDAPARAALFGRPKNGERRLVTLPRFLTMILSEHLEQVGPAPSALVFAAPEGGVVRHELFRRRFFAPAVVHCLAANALPMEKAGFRFHDLRHTCASIALANGYSLEQVRDRLGHKDTRTTARYAHLYIGHDDPLLDRLDAQYADVQAAATRPLPKAA